MKILIVGLGNPGEKYGLTRHNAGFRLVENLQKAEIFPEFQEEKKFQARLAKKNMGQKEIMLVLPQTFMNASGEAVAAVVNYYKIEPENIWVVHDDIDIKLGQIKVSRDKSSGGHHGVDSIIQSLGTKDFLRFRIGILPETGKPPAIKRFVLENFSADEEKKLEKSLSQGLALITENFGKI